MLIRLNKLFSQAGIASRRQAEKFIKLGKVKVNDKVVKDLGRKVDFEKDKIEFQGKPVLIQGKAHFIVNKPKGYLCTTRDRFNRPKVTDLVKDKKTRFYPVGRLDLDTEGLLIMTNDGDLAYKLTHPRHHIPKVYQAGLNRPLCQRDRKRLEKGVKLQEGKTLPAKILNLGGNKIEITIYEGKKRQIKRMLALFNYKVKELKRIAIGPLKLGNLASGGSRKLKPGEIAALLKNRHI